jgi:hypothetical protein
MIVLAMIKANQMVKEYIAEVVKEKNENNNMTYIVKRLSRMGLIIMRIIKI